MSKDDLLKARRERGAQKLNIGDNVRVMLYDGSKPYGDTVCTIVKQTTVGDEKYFSLYVPNSVSRNKLIKKSLLPSSLNIDSLSAVYDGYVTEDLELAKDNDMITIEEIKDHLAHTVYSSGARKSIIGFLIGRGIDTDDIEFAKRNCSAREESAKTFEDFLRFISKRTLCHIFGVIDDTAVDYTATINDIAHLPDPKIGLTSSWEICEETAKEFAEAVDALRESLKVNDFQIGDAVKYMPTPDKSSTEYVEAIAHGSNGETYLCLSNGEYVRPCYCVKYKAQGEERRKLIDKLNEVI